MGRPERGGQRPVQLLHAEAPPDEIAEDQPEGSGTEQPEHDLADRLGHALQPAHPAELRKGPVVDGPRRQGLGCTRHDQSDGQDPEERHERSRPDRGRDLGAPQDDHHRQDEARSESEDDAQCEEMDRLVGVGGDRDGVVEPQRRDRQQDEHDRRVDRQQTEVLRVVKPGQHGGGEDETALTERRPDPDQREIPGDAADRWSLWPCGQQARLHRAARLIDDTDGRRTGRSLFGPRAMLSHTGRTASASTRASWLDGPGARSS